MTITTTANKVVYAGNGSTTAFAFSFPVPNAASLSVTYTDANGIITTLASTLYTVIGLGSANGGTVTYPLSGSAIANGTKLTILRTVPAVQQTSFINQSQYNPSAIEAAFDYLTMLDQQDENLLSNCIQVPATDPPLTILPAAAARAGSTLVFDSQGQPALGMMTMTATGTIASVASITALRAITTSQPVYIAVTGYYVFGDGGGGTFVWNSASTAADDGGFTIQPTGVVTGRFIRIRTSEVVDIRYFGAGESQSTATNSAAFVSSVVYAQANFAKTTAIRAVGTFTFDPSLFGYVFEPGGAVHSYINAKAPCLKLYIGGSITFTSIFYQPFGWTVQGVGGFSQAQFQNGSNCLITGDYWISAFNANLSDVDIVGQLNLDGHNPTGTGQDAGVLLSNVSATITGARASSGTPALNILNKYFVESRDCVFTAVGTVSSDPTTSIKISSDFEIGLSRFENLTVGFGNIVIAAPGNNTNFSLYFNVTSESLTHRALFDISCGNATGIIDLDKCLLADVQVSGARLYDITGNAPRGLKISQCWPINGYGGDKLRYLDIDGLGIFFEYSSIDEDWTDWRPTQRRATGNSVTLLPPSEGFGAKPGFVKPSLILLGNTPSGWTTVPNGALDGITNAYSMAHGAGGQPSVIPQTISTGAASAGDVIIVGLWIRRPDQVNTAPSLNMQLFTGGGAQQTDAFTGTQLITGDSPMKRVAGYDWYYTWLAWKITSPGTFNINLFFEAIVGAGTVTIADLAMLRATGGITFLQAAQLAWANMRYPSTLTAGSPPANYYSWAPGAYHALNTNVGIGSPQANAVALLPGNAFASGIGATGSRPTGMPEGYLWYDSTLHKPIWSQGSNVWHDAAGNTV